MGGNLSIVTLGPSSFASVTPWHILSPVTDTSIGIDYQLKASLVNPIRISSETARAPLALTSEISTP